MKRQFMDITLRGGTLAAIETANRIIQEYAQQGYILTLRQLYYQHVARGLIENTERSYKNLGELVNKGRLAGLIDWAAIEDRTRNLQSLTSWVDPADIIDDAYRWFRLDKWENQNYRIECWVEKDALVGVLERVCNRHEVDYFSCRGYVSQSEMYEASRRIIRYLREGQEVVIFHLGDHDPSGIDMTRDIRERLDMFLDGRGEVQIERLALNWEQIEQYNPPPNPAKTTDARFQAYADEYGTESWELDALEPAVIEELIEQNILILRNDDAWEEKEDEENHHKELLKTASERWEEVEALFAP